MSSSSSESSSSSSPAPSRKRKRIEVEPSDSADEDAPPPLSHAERRRQKKRAKRAQERPPNAHTKKRTSANDLDAPPKREENGPAGKTPDPVAPRQKRQHSVWVGNLSFRTTQDALRAFFDGVGTITRVHMPMRRGKQDENMGFAYVDFDTSDAKTVAITLSEGHLDGRRLLIKDGDDFTGRPPKADPDPASAAAPADGAVKKATGHPSLSSKTAQKILRTQTQPAAPTLFLGNLGFETTEGAIRALFEAHRHWGKGKGADPDAGAGEDTDTDVWIRKIRMGTFEDSGACKGFAFVDFTSVEHATAALVNPRNHRLNGRDLVVEYASPDAVRRGGGGPRRAKGDQGRKDGQARPQTTKKGAGNVPYTKEQRSRHVEREDGEEGGVNVAVVATKKRPRAPDRAGHDRSHTRRARPGAALAQAQRQSAAILPSSGQKTVF